MKLLGKANAKTVKGERFGFLTFILYLAPSKISGYNTCPMASAGCAAACLFTAGMGKFKNVWDARVRKTIRFFEDRENFLADLVSDIEAGIRKGERDEMTPVFRLNGTSDIRWENYPVIRDGVEYPNVMTAFPNVQFYDYTKLPNRRNIPDNYHLTFSRSESNDDHIPTALDHGMNVAVVFDTKKKHSLPKNYMDLPVIDGDVSDLRFNDPKGSVVGLRAKGDAKKDDSGFVVTV